MTIHAFTEMHSDYPAYVNLTEQKDGAVRLTVRSRGNGGKDYASIDLTALQAEELADSIYKYAYEEEYDSPETVKARRAAITSPAKPGLSGLTALAAIEERLALTYRVCCGLAPKQAIGEGLHALIGMPEWATVRALLATQPVAQAKPDASERDAERFVFEHSNPDAMIKIETLAYREKKPPSIDWWRGKIDAAIAATTSKPNAGDAS